MKNDADFVAHTQEFKPTDFENLPQIAEGSESTVFRQGDRVLKVGEPYNATESMAPRVEEILRADREIGSGKLKVEGYYRGKNGVLNP